MGREFMNSISSTMTSSLLRFWPSRSRAMAQRLDRDLAPLGRYSGRQPSARGPELWYVRLIGIVLPTSPVCGFFRRSLTERCRTRAPGPRPRWQRSSGSLVKVSGDVDLG